MKPLLILLHVSVCIAIGFIVAVGFGFLPIYIALSV